jgi:peptidase A4-like protein
MHHYHQGRTVMLSRTRIIITCAAAAAGLAVSLAAPALATAQPAASAVAGPHGQLRFTSHGHPAGPATAAATSNRTFAGYQATVPAGSATVVTASFTVPTLACTTTDRAIAPDVGVPVNNYKSGSLAGLFTGCVGGTAVYYPSVVVNGTETDYPASPVAAGDVIDLTTKVSTNRTRVQVTDVTTGVTQKIIGAGAKASAAFAGDDAWVTSSGQLEHVPDFGKLTFKSCLLDGKALASWHPHAYQRVNSIGTLQISTGAFWPGGTAFTTHFQHS